MEISVYSDAHVGIGDHARRLEAAGFTHLWIYDSPLVFGEPYLAAFEALRATDRLAVGPGVTHPGSRPAVATAQALGTLAKAAPGRVVLGIGTGSSARHTLGLPPASLEQLDAYTRAVQSLLAGGEAECDERVVQFIHPTGRWLDLSHPVPTWVSAFGPRGRRRAAAFADGIMVRWEGAETLRAVRAEIDEAARAAGRRPQDVSLGVIYAMYPVEDLDELDGAEARAALGPLVVSRLRYLTNTFDDPEQVPERFRRAYRAYRAYRATLDERSRHFDNYLGYLTFMPPELEPFVDRESIATVCLAADPARIATELRAMAAAGVDHCSLQIAGSPVTWIDRMARIVAEIEYPTPSCLTAGAALHP
ncbi:LLM class flavin-dependent oxidoreductase [Pseudonocardia sp. RS010]|uniref:LLM class flavin-dependent oxidoreductase n=1 Tax=Pseudonocardia sp. RS010 TaxID=3385979 RepID=UPI0039A2B5E8